MENLRGAVIGFSIFLVVSLLALFAVIVVFAQLRFDDQTGYSAVFRDVSSLKTKDFVRIAGVEVGKVKAIDVLPGGDSARVRFDLDDDVHLTTSTTAQVRYENLVGDRYLALSEGVGDMTPVGTGYQIPIARTSPALDLDALLGGFKPLLRAVDPAQVNDLTGQLIAVFQGEGGNIASILQQAALFTNTLADRDELIGSVITNLKTVLATLARRNTEITSGLTSLSQTVDTLAKAPDLGGSVADISAASGTLAGLMTDLRPPARETITQTGRVSGQIMSDAAFFDNFLKTLPDTYAILGRQGLYGDFFAFYLCNVALKVNGPKGDPVIVTLAGQNTGRCAPAK